MPARSLRDLVEGPEALPRGRAIDLGCGRGSLAIYLAQHGWQATGVDAVERALRAARRRAGKSGVDVTFVRGDVTRLAQLPNLQSDFTSELAFVAAQVFDFARADKVESSAPCR